MRNYANLISWQKKKAGVPDGIAISFVFVRGKTVTTPFVYIVHEKSSWI